MKSLFYCLAGGALFVACQHKPAPPAPAPINDCYLSAEGRDTVALSYEQKGDTINGRLRYKNYEKDSSSGTVTGKAQGDTLVLEYTFQSEGTTSVSQLAFLKTGEQLVQGFGPIEEKEGKVVFKNLAQVKFDQQAVVLKKINCED